MTSKLILRNVRRSLKDYAIYFLTICLAVSMFYAFNSITSQPAMGDLSKSMAIWSNGLATYIGVMSKLISFFLAALILYANQFIMKRRSKELAIYTTLGMSQRKIAGIFVGETILIGATALVAGALIGFYLSQAMSALAVELFVGNVGELTLVFSLTAVRETMITFIIIYLVVALFSARSIVKIRLIDMLKQERTNQEITIRNPIVTVCSFVASMVLLGICIYILRTRGIGRDSIWPILIFMVLGIVLLFYSISTVIISISKKMKSFYFKGLNCFLIKQVSSKMKVNMWVMSTLTGLLLLSLTVLGVGLSVTGSFNQMVNNDKAVDFSILMDQEKGNPEELLKANSITPAQYVKKSEVLSFYASPLEYLSLVPSKKKDMSQMDKITIQGTISIVAESDYNNLLTLIGQKTIELKEDEYYINANYKSILPYYKVMLQEGKEIELYGKLLKNKGTEILGTDIMVGMSKGNPGVIIVDDSLVNGLTLESSVWNAKTLSREAEEQFYNVMNNTFLDMSLKDEIYYASRLVTNNTYVGMFGVIAFLCSYLGLILIIITLAVLALQQLTEMQENRNRYLNLAKLGASKSMLQKVINKQIGIYFLAPLVPALLLSIFVIKAVLEKIEPFFGMEMGLNLIISIAIILAMYLIYYVVTCVVAQNIIIDKRMKQGGKE